MRLVRSDGVALSLPPGHRFPLGKTGRVAERVAQEHAALLVPAVDASWEDLALVHEERYLRALWDGTLDASAQRRLGFPWSEALVARARRSAGGTLTALAWALARGAAGHMAGGTHHAFADHGEGYCALNDLAVAVAVARRDQGLGRIAVVDLDVHQGNGTAALLREQAETFTLSVHGQRNYPFRKEQSSLDVGLEDGCEDEAYLRAVDGALEVVEGFRPALVLYQAGVDVLSGDRLGRLALTPEGLRQRDQRVFSLAQKLRVPLLVTMGGGYGRDLERTVEAHAQVYRELVSWSRLASVG